MYILFMFINITPCGLCRSSIFPSLFLSFRLVRNLQSAERMGRAVVYPSFRLVRNLSCDPEQVEGFPTSGNDTENKDTIFRHPVVSAAG